jgi:putative tryptophan/tyrosine transport system substrate-binding protein
MRRREFITLLGGAALIWPLAAQAQKAEKHPIIGFMGSGTAALLSESRYTGFIQRLHELGWTEGRTVEIVYRWGEGRPERFADIMAEFVQLKVNIIITNGTPAVLAAKQATSDIPVVFPTAGDPVGAGLVAGLARPGGNITGLGFQTTETAGKRVELLREVVLNLRRVAILTDPDDPASAAEMRDAQTAGRAFGLEVTTIGVRRGDEIASAFETLQGHTDALYVATSPLFTANSGLIGTLALGARLPTMHSFREYVDSGGLISYGANFADLWWRAADIVDKILRGTKPGDIPIVQPTKFELVINLKSAKVLGISIPPALLALADVVIE